MLYYQDDLGRTALHWAGLHQQPDAVAALVQAKANVNIADCGGATGLLVAAQGGCPDCVHWMLEGGSSMSHQNMFGWDALHEAAYNGRTAVVNLLLGASVDPNTADNDGRTPLMKAAVMGRRECVGALLTAKADPLPADINNETALSLAHKKKFRPTAALLDRWIAGRVNTYYLSGEDDNPPGESRCGDHGLDMAARNAVWKAKASSLAHPKYSQPPKPPVLETAESAEVAIQGWAAQQEDPRAVEQRIASLEAALKASQLELQMTKEREAARQALLVREGPATATGPDDAASAAVRTLRPATPEL